MAAVLTLAKAIPRSWLRHGEALAVQHAPTTRGRVSYSLQSFLGGTVPHVNASVQLAKQSPSQERHGSFSSVQLVLRVPAPWQMFQVSMDGKAWHSFDAQGETITLPNPATMAASATAAKIMVLYRRID